jgi:hypothetical protein
MPLPQITTLGGSKLSSRQLIELVVTSKSKALTVELAHTSSGVGVLDMMSPVPLVWWSP